MSDRKNYSTGAPWESIVGYSRAVQKGNVLEISGTTASENGNVVAPGDAYQQTKFILEKIEYVLKESGFDLTDVIRTRMFVTDISRWKEYGKAHAEFFETIRPATSMIEIKSLIDAAMLIEIEVTAMK